jgi:hypothetical protein
MRKPILLPLLAALLSAAAAAQDCGIDNAVASNLGPGKAVTGTCANSGQPVECDYAVDGTVSCTGPNGSFSGNDPNALVASACGCGE